MLFLDRVYVERPDGALQFRWVKAPTSAELTHLAHHIAQRVGRFLERQGLLERDAENGYLAGEAVEAAPMDQVGHDEQLNRNGSLPISGTSRQSWRFHQNVPLSIDKSFFESKRNLGKTADDRARYSGSSHCGTSNHSPGSTYGQGDPTF